MLMFVADQFADLITNYLLVDWTAALMQNQRYFIVYTEHHWFSVCSAASWCHTPHVPTVGPAGPRTVITFSAMHYSYSQRDCRPLVLKVTKQWCKSYLSQKGADIHINPLVPVQQQRHNALACCTIHQLALLDAGRCSRCLGRLRMIPTRAHTGART